MPESTNEYAEGVHLRENKRILKLVDQAAAAKGSDRSALYREAMRFWLASNGFLTRDEKIVLGVNSHHDGSVGSGIVTSPQISLLQGKER